VGEYKEGIAGLDVRPKTKKGARKATLQVRNEIRKLQENPRSAVQQNESRWLHSHFSLTCPEAIQRLVRERDNLFRRQGIAILGGVRIAGQQHVLALSHSPADCGIYTKLRLAPGDYQAFDAARLQLRLQTRLMMCLLTYIKVCSVSPGTLVGKLSIIEDIQMHTERLKFEACDTLINLRWNIVDARR
jgi:hypothetical protein